MYSCIENEDDWKDEYKIIYVFLVQSSTIMCVDLCYMERL